MMESFDTELNDNFQLNKANKNKQKPKTNISRHKIEITIITILITSIIFILSYKCYFSSPPFYNVLIGDIGGTNIRLKLLKMTKDINIEPKTIKSEYKSTFLYHSLEYLLKDFISKLKPNNKPQFAILGIPGPVENNQLITLPNIPHWNLENGDRLGKKLGIKKFIFLNDFVCNGYAIQTNLKENVDYLKLNNVSAIKDGPKLMIGPGTGLGMGFLLKNKNDKY